jgi:hypothetical protein
MSGIKITTTTQRTERFRIELTGNDITKMLRNHPRFSDIPDRATISFHIPGGGDWSNTSIKIDDENPIYIEWQTETVEQS